MLWYSPCLAAAVTFGSVATGHSEILFDHSPPPPPPVRLIKRAQDSSATTATGTSIASSTTETSALPSPFDSSIGNNFTASSCPAFFQTFLSSSAINECLPLSLLLQTSNSFFTVEQSPVLLAQTLEVTCSVNLTVCSTLMASLARQIQLTSNCGADLIAKNPTVIQAYNGLAAYDTLYHAGCLMDSSTGNYCFSDAVTNASSPTSSYTYYLPLGISLPSNTNPTCSTCLQNTMTLFAGTASNTSQPISSIYTVAAEQIDRKCGDNFANTTIARKASSSSATSLFTPARGNGLGLTALAIAISVLLY
ncbi:hypothetical protein BDV97DRAFT_290688 [Delphinella strobiligena]|nr:hypothetical protein BDV97DRAFT_290688 [Delphinella strobiligena]